MNGAYGAYVWDVCVDEEGMIINFRDGRMIDVSFEDPDQFYGGIPEAIQAWLARLGVEV